MDNVPETPRNALLAGATGLVGRSLLPMLLAGKHYRRVACPTASHSAGADARERPPRQLTLDMNAVEIPLLPLMPIPEY